MYTESNIKLSCNALWQKCVLATLYRAAATHPKIKLLQFKLILDLPLYFQTPVIT
ncbi:Uncharacterised protein [Escherichia coli]|uniref:Uncharacterized protein n=1 Tax=Escherichia coli TaxID=562 RepID=A0A376KYE5_ECOLX|nr:Uncharacterised protein [Escherichia coli]